VSTTQRAGILQKALFPIQLSEPHTSRTTASLMVRQKLTLDVPNRNHTSSSIYLTSFAFSKARYLKSRLTCSPAYNKREKSVVGCFHSQSTNSVWSLTDRCREPPHPSASSTMQSLFLKVSYPYRLIAH
jgi:hypothetical protein